MAGNLPLSDTKARVKSVIFGLAIFIFWSFLSIYAVLAQPLNGPNPALQIFNRSDNLAFSIAGEIIASYFSPFAMLNMLLLFLAIVISSILRAGISRQMTSKKKRTSNPLQSLFRGNQSNIIILADRMKGYGDDTSVDVEAIVAPATIEIPAKTAVILEMNDEKQQVITGKESGAPYHYRLENGSTIIGLFPFEKQKNRMKFEAATPFGKNDSEEWFFQYGFPVKKTKGHECVDPDSILAAVEGGDYSLWKRLIQMSILSSLTSIGFRIKHGDMNHPNYFHLVKREDAGEQIIQNRENGKITFQSHKRMYKIPSRKRSIHSQSSIRRNRNFSRSLPITYLSRLLLNKQKKTFQYSEIFNHSLQQKFRQNFSTNMRNFYNYPVAEVEIIQTYKQRI